MKLTNERDVTCETMCDVVLWRVRLHLLIVERYTSQLRGEIE